MRFAFVCLILCALGAAAAPLDDRAESAEYEVYYHHTVRNKTDRTLTDVRVYLPVPQSDDYQEISEFRIEMGAQEFAVSDRTDSYGTKIKRITIPTLEPGTEARLGFSCAATLRPP